MKKIKITKEIEKLDENLSYENSYIEEIFEISLVEKENELEITYKKEESQNNDKELHIELEELVQHLVYSKDNFKLQNIEEIINNWKKLKKESILKDQSKNVVSMLMHISKYYENGEILEKIIEHYSFIQFLLYFYKNKAKDGEKSELSVCGIISNEKVEFQGMIEKGEDDNEYSLKTSLDPSFDIVEYEKELLDILQIPNSTFCPFTVELKGKYIYKEELEGMKIEIDVIGRDVVKYKKIIELI